MLNISQAADIVRKNFPEGKIEKVVSYKDLYVFQVFTDDEEEGLMDPFRSVHKETGKFDEFSVLTDADDFDIFDLFEAAQKYKN